MTAAHAKSLADLLRARTGEKETREWQEQLWEHRPRPEAWPAVLDAYEAAAYLRVNHTTIRTLLVKDRKGRAQLRHQRIGAAIRIARADLDRMGSVPGRVEA